MAEVAMNRRFMSFIFLVGIVGSLFSIPFTTPGGIKVPDGYVLSDKMSDLSYVSYMSSEIGKEYEHNFAVCANLGLFDKLQVGFVGTSVNVYYANVKFQAIRETESLPAIAIGIDNLFSKVDDFRNKDGESASDYDFTDPEDYTKNSLYFVMSKTALLRGLPFVPFLETTMNVGMGKRRFEGNIDLSKQLQGAFIGLNFKPSAKFTIYTEMDGYNINTGFAYNYSNFTFRTGLYRIEELDRNDKVKFAVNLKYTFDKFSSTKFNSKTKTTYVNRRNVVPGKRYYSTGNDRSSDPVLEELNKIKERRKQAEKELEDIKKLLQE